MNLWEREAQAIERRYNRIAALRGAAQYLLILVVCWGLAIGLAYVTFRVVIG